MFNQFASASEINVPCLKLIDCFLVSASIPLNFQCLNLKDLFYQTTYELSLSQIEILAWLILLEEIEYKIEPLSQKQTLQFTALKAKVKLGHAVYREIEEYDLKNPSFMVNFKSWSSTNLIEEDIITTEKLNQKYKELNLPIDHDFTNYNYYVDSILASAPTYCNYLIGEKRKKRSTKVHFDSDMNFIDEREFERIDS
ncbi:hypothetical protein SteCoe_26606 [Stentor coeruleus]|uniref:Cyclin N-terminal domain-containing protein n=1 Tax=Stentor coeruleus TaxID=5963 RepID=A0A1R2BCG5_9CILI|nr:hypothetical protein SteCoe_26606 [Stentor coeruleus]